MNTPRTQIKTATNVPSGCARKPALEAANVTCPAAPVTISQIYGTPPSRKTRDQSSLTGDISYHTYNVTCRTATKAHREKSEIQ